MSWRYPAKTAGLCLSVSLNVFIFTPNVKRVEILWFKEIDICGLALLSVKACEREKLLLTSPDDTTKAFIIFLMYSNLP